MNLQRIIGNREVRRLVEANISQGGTNRTLLRDVSETKRSSAADTHRLLGKKQSTLGSDVAHQILSHELVHIKQQQQMISRRMARAENDRSERVGAERHWLSTLTIQRSATWTPPPSPTEDLDLAARVLANPTSLHVGYTEDKLDVKSTPDLFGGQSNGDFELKVHSLPSITNSAESHVLSKPPWSARPTRTELSTKFAQYEQDCGPPANESANLRVQGEPNPAAIVEAVKLHEADHAALIEAAFIGTFVQWDQAIEAAKNAGTLYHGATEVDAKNDFYQTVGGTPEQVRGQYVSERDAAHDTFHGTPLGLNLQVSGMQYGEGTTVPSGSVKSGKDCGNVVVFVAEDPATIEQKKLERQHRK